MRKNRKNSYYFSGTPSIIGGFFQLRSADYNRYIREQKTEKGNQPKEENINNK